MNSLLIVISLLLGVCALAQPEELAIRGVSMVDVTDGSLRADQVVLIEGQRIKAVGPVDGVRIPAGAEVIDGVGGYLIPGLWDMHVHSVWRETEDPDAVGTADWHLPLFLAHGVTGIRNMNDGTGDVTLALIRSVKSRLAAGDLLGPRLLANGPKIEGEPSVVPGSNAVVVRTAEEARTAVDRLADAGADFIKVYETLSRDAYFAIMEQAQRRGIPVDGHVPFRITPTEAAEAGQRTVEHPEALAVGCVLEADAEAERDRFASVLSGYGSLPESEQFLVLFRHHRELYDRRNPAACTATFEAYRNNGVAVTVDLLGYHHLVHAEEILADTASMRLVPQALRREWEDWLGSATSREFQSILRPIVPLEPENTRLANEAGVVLLAGTDVGVSLQVPGLSLHRELARLVEAGLSPAEALRTATLNPARVLGLADSLGTVEAGKLADLVLLDANPLEDIRNTRKIRAVVANGRLFRRADLDRLLAEAVTEAAADARQQ